MPQFGPTMGDDPTLPPRANRSQRFNPESLTTDQLESVLAIMRDTECGFEEAIQRFANAPVPAPAATAFARRMTEGDLRVALQFMRREQLTFDESVARVAGLQEPRMPSQFGAGPDFGPTQENPYVTQLPAGPSRVATTTIAAVNMAAELTGSLGISMSEAMSVIDRADQTGANLWDAMKDISLNWCSRCDPDTVALLKGSSVAIERAEGGGGPLSARQGM